MAGRPGSRYTQPPPGPPGPPRLPQRGPRLGGSSARKKQLCLPGPGNTGLPMGAPGGGQGAS
eukprot:2317597-Lingulodinium_polyedra.AAC.1